MFVGEGTIISGEGTTHGDPLSMAVYALSTLPLISQTSQLTETWFADDTGGGASLQVLHQWWTALSEVGPRNGYYVRPLKTWQLVKQQFKDSVQELFGKYGTNSPLKGGHFCVLRLELQTFSIRTSTTWCAVATQS